MCLLAMTLAITAFTKTIDKKTISEEPQKAESAPKTISVTKVSTVDSSNPLNLVPADALACLRINNFNNVVQSLDKYMAGLLPIPVPLSMMAAPQIGNLLGSPMLSGIDLAGDVFVFLSNDMGAKAPPIVVMVPVTSYQEFISGNPNCSKADADGISTISPPMAMLGKLLTVKAPGGKYAYVCIEPSKPTLMKAISSIEAGSLGARLTANEQKLTKTAPLWVYGNAEQAAAMFKPMLGMALQSVPKQGGVDLSSIIMNSIDQVKSLSITLTPTEQKLALGLSLSAKPGTDLAKTLIGDTDAKPGFELAGYLKDKAAINVAAKLNKSLLTKLVDEMMVLAKANPAAAPVFGGMDAMVKQNLEFIGDEMACSMAAGSGAIPISFKQITYLSNSKQMIAQYDEKFNMLAAAQGPNGTKMAEITTYGNDKIYSMKIPMGLPTPGAGDMPRINTAISDDMMIVAMGDIADMKTLVHSTKAKTTRPSGDMAKALQMVDNSAEMDFVASLNLIRLISLGGKAASSVPVPQAQMVGGMLSGLDANTKSCMAISGKIDGGRFDLGIVIPKDHLSEVINAGMQMQQKMMQNMQPGMGGDSGSIKFEVTE